MLCCCYIRVFLFCSPGVGAMLLLHHYISYIFLLTRGRCWDEYLELHDGDSADSPLMGRFCKSDIPDITSSGSDLYMVFASGPDLPPYGLNGFHISAYSLTQGKFSEMLRYAV